MEQVSPQISLKRNPIERAVPLRNREGAERFSESFAVGGRGADAPERTRGNGNARRKQEDLEYIIN